jgi:hypothetical protein
MLHRLNTLSAILILCFLQGCFRDLPSPNLTEQRLATNDPTKAKRSRTKQFACYRDLTWVELKETIEQLGEKRDFATLEEISQTDIPFASVAVSVMIQHMEPAQALDYCKHLVIGTELWHTAISALAYHPKEKVIGYLQELALSPNPEARYACYALCLASGWPDCLVAATRDLTNPYITGLPNMPIDRTLGAVARQYVSHFESPSETARSQ